MRLWEATKESTDFENPDVGASLSGNYGQTVGLVSWFAMFVLLMSDSLEALSVDFLN